MAFFEIRERTRRRVFQILDREFTVGSAEGDALRIAAEGVRAQHLRVATSPLGAHRVEPGVSGAELLINGRPLPLRTLEHGDRIRLGPFELVYCVEGQPRPAASNPDAGATQPATGEPRAGAVRGLGLQIDAIPSSGPPAPSSSAAARSPRSGGRRRAAPEEVEPTRTRRPTSRRGMSSTLLLWNAALIAVVVGYLVYRHFAAQHTTRDPRDLVTLAESQRASGDEERALATLGLALEGTTDDALRKQIRTLQVQLRARLAELADAPVLDRARAGASEIRRFVELNLADPPPTRPAARELVGLSNAWLASFRDTCARHESTQPMVADVEALLARFRSAAHASEPDDAQDVLFSAARRTRFVPRRYPEAIAILERWLAAAAADVPDRAVVEERVRSYHEQGRQWAAEQRQAIDRMLQRGETERAIAALHALIDLTALPEWLGDEHELLRRLGDR